MRTSHRTDRSARTRTARRNAPQRRLRAHRPDSHRAAKKEPAVAYAAYLEPAGSQADDDPVDDRPELDGIRPDPAARAVRRSGQAEPNPRCAVGPATRRQREHDLELVVGPEAAEPANDPSRRPGLRSHRDRAEKLSRGREPRWQVGCESPIGTGCEERNRERRDNRQPSCARSHRTEDSETDGPHAVASVEGPCGSSVHRGGADLLRVYDRAVTAVAESA